MKLKEFQLERLFAKHRTRVKHVLSASSCESVSMREIIDMADKECLAMWENLSLGYTDPRGCAQLRESVAGRFTSITQDDILEVVPEEGIFIFMNTRLSPGDEVIVMHPCLPSLYELPLAIGCKVIRWPLEITSWGWKLDIGFLADNISPRTKLLVLNLPNNPTGYLPVRAELDKIVELADRTGIWLLCEETYRGMEHDPGGALPSLADLYTRSAVVGGLNKYGLPGTRIGWMVTKNRPLMAECSAFKDYITLSNNAPGEVLATIAMRNAKTLLQRNHKIVLKNLAIAENFFQKKHRKHFQWIQPNGGSTAFPKLLPPLEVAEMCERAISEKGLLIIGDRVFDLNGNHFRVGLGRNNFTESLALFEEVLGELLAERKAGGK